VRVVGEWTRREGDRGWVNGEESRGEAVECLGKEVDRERKEGFRGERGRGWEGQE